MFDTFIHRPVLSMVVSLMILLLGVKSLMELPIRQYPEMKNTVITVTVTFPGADAELMQGFVTQPLQKAVAGARGIDYLTSRSLAGVSEIKVMVNLNEDPNAAMTEVISKVAEVRSLLPRGINDPTIVKTTGDAFAPMYLAFSSDVLTAQQITDYVTRVIQPKLATVRGVASPEIFGGQKVSMRIWLDPERMAVNNISTEEVKAALQANNVLSAAGGSKGLFEVIGTTARTDLRSVEEFRRLVVRGVGAQLVRLGDLATVELGPESAEASVIVDGKKAVFVGVTLGPEANPLTVLAEVRDKLPAMARDLPPGVTVKVAYDVTVFISAAIDEVAKTIAEAAIVVMVVIFLFMGSLRSILIPLVTVPLSLIGVALFLLMLGYSINLLTLLAMVLAIGLVVDDTIVVVENIHRHISEGLTPMQAALTGTREIASAIMAMTVTLAAVYAPIAFMGGLTGSLFSEFAFALAGSVVISGFIALTLSPMMSSRILRHDDDRRGLSARIDVAFQRVQRGYRRMLHASLMDRSATIVFALIVTVSLVFLYRAIPSELAPAEDQSAILIGYQGPANANLDYMERFAAEIDEALAALPETESYFTINGFPSLNSGFAAAILKPWQDRTRDQEVLIPEVQQGLDRISGIRGSAFPVPSLPGTGDGMPVQFVVTSTADYTLLAQVGQQLLGRAQDSGLFAYLDLDLKFETPQTIVEIDRDKVAAYGLTLAQIGDALATMTGGAYVNLINLYGRSYQVIPQVPRQYRLEPEALGRYHVKTATGGSVPLSSFIELHQVVRPSELKQFNQLNAVTLSAVPMPGVTLGTAVNFLSDNAREVLPRGFDFDYAGQSRQFIEEGGTLVGTFFFALLVIYLVLAAQFESFRDPLVVLVSVPLSLCGALAPLALGVTTMNIYSQVGLITLIGLITKHGILICEVAREQQMTHGRSRREAVEVAASLRLRPILMTTAAMVAGLVPLMFASGAGSASRFSIAVVIVAGMLVGTLFTLFVLPVVYTLLATERRRTEAPADTPALVS